MSEERKGRIEGARAVTRERKGLTESLSIPRNPTVTALPLPDRDDMEMTVGILIAVVVSILAISRLLRSRVGRSVPPALRRLLWQIQKLGRTP